MPSPSTTQRSAPFWRPKLDFSGMFDNLSEDLAAALLEFIGTAFFLLIGLGGIEAASEENRSSRRQASNIQQVLYVSTCMGFSLLVSAWLFFRITGGLFNPNVSLALLLVGVIKPLRFVLYCIAQLLGAIAGSALLLALTSGELSVNTVLNPGTSSVRGVFIEMFITSALVLAVLMLAAEKHQATAFAPIGIGLMLFACHLFAVYYTGASMNTARSFGPAVVTGFATPNHWVYWVGPFLGSLLGSAFFATIRHYHYWTLNPDQDATQVLHERAVLVARELAKNDGVMAASNAESRGDSASNDSDEILLHRMKGRDEPLSGRSCLS